MGREDASTFLVYKIKKNMSLSSERLACINCELSYDRTEVSYVSIDNEFGKSAPLCNACHGNMLAKCDDCNSCLLYVGGDKKFDSGTVVKRKSGEGKIVCFDCWAEPKYNYCENCTQYVESPISKITSSKRTSFQLGCSFCINMESCSACGAKLDEQNIILSDTVMSHICFACFDTYGEDLEVCAECDMSTPRLDLAKRVKNGKIGVGLMCKQCETPALKKIKVHAKKIIHKAIFKTEFFEKKCSTLYHDTGTLGKRNIEECKATFSFID